MRMKMEQWIEQRMEKFSEKFGDRLHDHEFEWIAAMLESAWSRGNDEGKDQAYENVRKWREEKNE